MHTEFLAEPGQSWGKGEWEVGVLPFCEPRSNNVRVDRNSGNHSWVLGVPHFPLAPRGGGQAAADRLGHAHAPQATWKRGSLTSLLITPLLCSRGKLRLEEGRSLPSKQKHDRTGAPCLSPCQALVTWLELWSPRLCGPRGEVLGWTPRPRGPRPWPRNCTEWACSPPHCLGKEGSASWVALLCPLARCPGSDCPQLRNIWEGREWQEETPPGFCQGVVPKPPGVSRAFWGSSRHLGRALVTPAGPGPQALC